MDMRARQRLGEPDLKLAGFVLWIHSRQFPAAADYWDGNWLNVTAFCGRNGAEVWTSGNIVHLSEIHQWMTETQVLYEALAGTAALVCMEPELGIKLKAESRGRITMTVDITPNHLSQQHRFEFDIDQGDLPPLLAQGRKVLAQFPLKATDEGNHQI